MNSKQRKKRKKKNQSEYENNTVTDIFKYTSEKRNKPNKNKKYIKTSMGSSHPKLSLIYRGVCVNNYR